MCNNFEIGNFGVNFVCLPALYKSFWRTTYEQTLEPVPLVFTTRGAIAPRRIKSIHI